MTHNHLLAKIDLQKDNAFEGFVFTDAFDALRAVVELHKPMTHTNIVLCQECECLYPCPTIRAIKGELE